MNNLQKDADRREGGLSSADMKEIISKLQRNYSFFSDLLEDEVTELLDMSKNVSFESDSIIFNEGDIADRFFLVLTGEIGITIGKKEVARVRRGQLFGEMALLEHIPRTATATALKKSALFSFPAEIISTVLPGLALKVVISIARQRSEKLRETNSHILIS